MSFTLSTTQQLSLEKGGKGGGEHTEKAKREMAIISVPLAACVPKHVLISSNAIHNVISHYCLCHTAPPPPFTHITTRVLESHVDGPRAAAKLPPRTFAKSLEEAHSPLEKDGQRAKGT